MKVSNKAGQGLQNIDAAKTAKTDGNKKAESSKSRLGDLGQLGDTAKVNVSERAQGMQKAKEIASQQTVDEAKVARLQKLIDEGKYKVDSKAVADRLVDEQLVMIE
jgi:negative regulator of flagellin synthesis FlgM